jgi:anti-sigma regulatory factor (Ser/Thr protein kinase)
MRVLAIDNHADVRLAGDLAKLTAERMGFSRLRATEIGLVACELASNIVKHAWEGELQIEAVEDRCELELIARDGGPPFRDFARALRDGWTDEGPIDPATVHRRAGLGAGLGAVARLADDLTCEQDEDGKSVRARFRFALPAGER